MKNLNKLMLVVLVVIAFCNYANAQTSLGTSENFMGGLKKEIKNSTSKSSGLMVSLKVSDSKEFDGKVNYQKSETSSEFLNGEINGIPESSFFIKVSDNTLEGHIMLKKSKEAYKYYSDDSGKAYVAKVDINSLVCINYRDLPDTQKEESLKKGQEMKISRALLNLQSLPGAAGCVLLDFDGHYMPAGNLWNNGNPINAAPSGMSDAAIRHHWEVVAEDYRPFNLNITTNESVFNSYPRNRRMRVIITPTKTAAPSAGGVAYVGSFNWNNDVPCWTFILSGKSGGEASSHEIGHTFDLRHDGRTSPREGYFRGIDGTPWAPIMGVGYYRPVTQWSKGEYTNANNRQDDVATIAGNKFGVGYRSDDYANSISGATSLTYNASGAVSQKNGIITSEADWDFFTFTTGGGNVALNVNTVNREGNLDIIVRLYNESGAQIGSYTNTSPGALNASLRANLPAGKYYLSVDGTGAGNPAYGGYSAYASLGSYSITGTIPPGGGGGEETMATVYQHCDYAGYAVALPLGDYTLSQLQAKGIRNNDISSLQVKSGYEVVVYRNDNFTGESIVLNSDDNCFVDEGYNDVLSSLRVRNQSSTTFSRLIQAEDYSTMSGIQTENTTDVGGGLNIGYAHTGDWMSYHDINFPETGSYLIEYRVASTMNTAVISPDLDSSIVLGTLNIPNTGGWQNWQTISQTVNINAGTYNFGIYIQSTGVNINWIKITKVNDVVTQQTVAQEVIPIVETIQGIHSKPTFTVYPNPTEDILFFNSDISTAQVTVMHAQIGFLSKHKVNNNSIDVSYLNPGLYSIIIEKDGERIIKRFIKK